MAARLDQLAQVLFNRQTLADCNANELQAMAERYPYFSAAQYLLIKRLAINNGQNAEAMHAAALYNYQPLALLNIFSVNDKEEQKGFQNVSLPPEETKSFDQKSATPVQEQKGFENVEELEQLPAEEQMPIAPLVMPPTQEGSLEITFEPFHTVDYFASQGIKLSQTDLGNDNFGKQLKSFTEWLKTMKKVSTAEAPSLADAKGESKVVNLAAHSLQNTDVLTEAMADVWVKQGNIEKAKELYNKLSLLNPSKKAYFASKIESLKK